MAILVVGGEAPSFDLVRNEFIPGRLLVAVDSGLDLFRSWDVEPDLIVGDMDSISDARILDGYPRTAIVQLDRAKDESDTEAALRVCAERGIYRSMLVGGGGGRLDHLLALRSIFERQLRPELWYLAHEVVLLVESGRDVYFSIRPGSLVSVFPLALGSKRMRSCGLRWPLEGLSWGPGDYGLSNESTSIEVMVGAGEGDLLVIYPLVNQ
ncbi:MAG: thiamine diphosphokinase, partial [Spirochaetota bacterium]